MAWPWRVAQGVGAGPGEGEPHRCPLPCQVLRSLNKTYQNLKRKPVAIDLDPKAVTCDELFGIINPATREWKDGKNRGSALAVGSQRHTCQAPALCVGMVDTGPGPEVTHLPLPGLFSTIMRDLANITHDGPKWIVLDGDIDPMWIESLNTVMDDNKV